MAPFASAFIHIVPARENCSPIQESRVLTEMNSERFRQMAKTIPVIGLDSTELGWVRLLVFLLRHPDPVVPQLACQAMRHIEEIAGRTASQPDTLDHAG